MSTEVAVMQKALKVEVQSPVKPEVLKPSNTANLQNITNISAKIPSINNKAANFTNKITSNAVTKTTDSFTTKHMLGRVNIRIQPITSKPSVIRSPYPQSTKSPFKPLTPIRPSPTTKNSLTSPAPTTPNTPTRTPTSVSKALDSSSLSASFNALLASPSSSSTISLSPTKCRRRISYSDTEVRIPVSRRNARERNRVKQVSQGFAILRQHVPQAARKKKLSKVETLRCAVDYIRGLQLLLDNHPSTTQQPLTAAANPSYHHHHHHHQQQQQQLQHPHQVFLQPHSTIEPHILKLPVADEAFHSPASLRYDGIAGAFLRTSPTESEGGQSPSHIFYSDKLSSSSTTSPSSSSSSSTGVCMGTIKTEGNDTRNYGREEQDLLEALAWWQHNIQP
nr:probable serine/threonine-protein kinase DDB_G0277165 [Procambarus clarkii]